MQKQTIPINKSTENKPVKMFVIVSWLDIFFLLHIMVSLIRNFETTLPINLFLQTQFL